METTILPQLSIIAFLQNGGNAYRVEDTALYTCAIMASGQLEWDALAGDYAWTPVEEVEGELVPSLTRIVQALGADPVAVLKDILCTNYDLTHLEHPQHTWQRWTWAIDNDETLLDYARWVGARIVQEQVERTELPPGERILSEVLAANGGRSFVGGEGESYRHQFVLSAIEAARREGAGQETWIPVDVDLPTPDVNFNGWSRPCWVVLDGETSADAWHYDRRKNCWHMRGQNHTARHVTHWRYLPLPPRRS